MQRDMIQLEPNDYRTISDANRHAADSLLAQNDLLRRIVHQQDQRIRWLENLVNILGEDGPSEDDCEP